ncbi:hypothetical protein K227x_56520 [Rubripirellula lacrimiformis]|uniref:3-keto-disaccharide hydrolase domain-containing protein n=1 Tax=Rubripirellula lacrimiformis TaxID=1930273 RepID=A0A517NJD3_9BACT|nr:hypothetical protein [Rubripirellula lacrimiformis]QDT07227.1 hypothetical protein K227x_56520 [Rubripirellula lacrimiformis]
MKLAQTLALLGALTSGSASLAQTAAVAPSDVSSADAGQVVFREDFESGTDRWQILDPATWQLVDHDGNHALEITARASEYKPPVRSPGHVALVKDLEIGTVDITFRVRSTKDTGNHRDCCVFFGYQDDRHFYYVHVGAKPDPHSGQIMIVNDAPRLALTENERLTPWDDAWHTVRLSRNVETGTIRLYFDDMENPHMEIVDKTFGAGRIGIGSFDDLNEFDDIVVTRPAP